MRFSRYLHNSPTAGRNRRKSASTLRSTGCIRSRNIVNEQIPGEPERCRPAPVNLQHGTGDTTEGCYRRCPNQFEEINRNQNRFEPIWISGFARRQSFSHDEIKEELSYRSSRRSALSVQRSAFTVHRSVAPLIQYGADGDGLLYWGGPSDASSQKCEKFRCIRMRFGRLLKCGEKEPILPTAYSDCFP